MRTKRLWNAFQAWLEYRPEGMDDHTARVFAMARAGFPCAAAAHFVLCFVFYLLGLEVLFVFNIGSTILWSYVVWRVNWHGDIKAPFFLGVVVEARSGILSRRPCLHAKAVAAGRQLSVATSDDCIAR